MKIAQQQIVYRPLTELRASKRNARRHRKRQIERIKACIQRFGFLGALLVTADGEVIAGHARLEAGKGLGMETVPCIEISHLTEEERRAFMLADNRLAELAEWDMTILAQEFTDLTNLNFDVSLTGFDLPKIDMIIHDSSERRTSAAEDAIPDVRSGTPVSTSATAIPRHM